MLNTLHDGPFTQMKEQGDIHVHHYQKGENPDDKKKKEKESKANGNGNGNGAPANGNGNGAPVEAEAAPPPPEDKGNPLAKFSKDEVKRIRDILKKDKEEKEPEKKLSNKKDKVNTKPKMKDTEVKEMSADLAYRAMDKADKKSRGEMSVMDPKRARKKARQSRKFADYSIKKTLKGEEFEYAHNQALEENAKRDIMAFGAKLKGYSDRSGGIDKDYFNKIANTALSGRMPDKRDIDGDTDPRDFVLDMMNRTFPKATMQNYAGISPSLDQYLRSTTGVKTHVSQNLKRSVTVPEEVELDEVESDYAKEIEAFKAQGGKIKKLPPGKKFKSKFSKVKGPKKLPIQAEDAEIEENVAYLKNKEGHVFHISKRDKKGDAYSMHVADSSGKKVKDWGSHPSLSGAKKFASKRGFTEEVDFEEAYTMHKGMKIKNVPRSAGKDAVEYNKKRREAQRKRAGFDEAKKPNLTAGMECQECGKKFRAKLSTLQYGKTKCPKCKSTDLDFAFGAKNESSVNGIVEGYQKAVLLSLDDAGIDGHFDRDKVVVAKRDVERAKEVLDNDPDIRRTPKIVGEEVETVYEARKSDYQIYHKDFSSAMQHAYAVAKKRGYTVDPQEIDNKVATGPRKPSSGKTNRYILGTDKKQNLHVQVANLDNKRYELNMYIEEVIPEETKMIPTNEKKLDPVGQEDGDVDNDGDKDSSDDYLMKRRNAVKKAMGKRKTGMKEEHQLNTMTDGAFTTADMLAQTYLSMSRDEQIQVTEVTNEDLKKENIDEVESAYAKQIADYKAKGGTVKKYTGPNMKNVKRATSGFKKKLAKTNKIVAQELEKVKAEKEANKQQDEAWKKGTYHVKDADGKIHGTYKSGKHASKAMHKLMDKGGHKELEVSRANEEVSKNVGKLNKVLENRKLERNKVVVDGQGGAGEVGTDELTKKYQEVTPGQPKELIRESSVVINSQDMFKRFEDMVSYMMGISVTHPESFQMFPIGESGKMRLEYEHGPLATICETDVINFFGPNVDMEQFVEMVKEFGVNVTTADNSFVVGDTPGTEGIVKEITPGQYAEEYAKKYTTGGMMDQMRANIEELAKRI